MMLLGMMVPAGLSFAFSTREKEQSSTWLALGRS